MARDILKLIYQDAYNRAQTSARTFNRLFYAEGTTKATEDAHKQSRRDSKRLKHIGEHVRTRNMSSVERFKDLLGVQ